MNVDFAASFYNKRIEIGENQHYDDSHYHRFQKHKLKGLKPPMAPNQNIDQMRMMPIPS